MSNRDSKITSKIMSSIKSKNTKPEITLRKFLWERGYRYRINYKKVYGKPDIVFIKKRIAIFVDGDFWHGNNWKIRGLSSLEEELKSYKPFWKEKILRNIQRDLTVTNHLKNEGWVVLRYWESDIKKSIETILEEITVNLN